MPTRHRRNPVTTSTKVDPLSDPALRAGFSNPPGLGLTDPLDADDGDDEEEETDDDDDDDDDDDEEEETEAEPAAARPPAVPPAANGAAAGSDSVKIPGRAGDPFSPPTECAYIKVNRIDATKVGRPCGVLDPRTGVIGYQVPPASLSPGGILATWGSGVYDFLYFDQHSKLCGKRRAELDHPEHPEKAAVYRPPVAAPPAAVIDNPRPPPPRRRAPPEGPSMLSLLAQLEKPGVGGGGFGLTHFLLLEEFFSGKNAVSRANDREEYELRLARIQADQRQQFEEAEARHARMLREDDARHRRELEHVTALSSQLVKSSTAAMNVSDLRDEIAELAEDFEAGKAAQPNLISALAPIVQPIVEMVLSQRKHTSPAPIAIAPPPQKIEPPSQ